MMGGVALGWAMGLWIESRGEWRVVVWRRGESAAVGEVLSRPDRIYSWYGHRGKEDARTYGAKPSGSRRH